ncbi:hypothetical protein EV421DRAFT_1905443 [Armillaria borealis]|uniref:RING-type domain-containing protein n=1 Tax=Armillaria borealis TaxID=47425 RepID=A0AA39MN12_9AGAR|nr:hypothetical protein EV421DRAFT_1905443 [Armillaria borealis]
MSSTDRTAIIEGNSPDHQTSQQEKKRKAKRDVIVISSDEEDASTIAENKISDLTFTIKRLKRENCESKIALNVMDKLVTRYADDLEQVREELEELRQDTRRCKIDPAKLKDDLLCAICKSKMWHPFIYAIPSLPDCGHIFCEGCIREWFVVTETNYRRENLHFHHNMPILVPDLIRQAFLQTYIEH